MLYFLTSQYHCEVVEILETGTTSQYYTEEDWTTLDIVRRRSVMSKAALAP